jgi:hypothetical protein
VIARVLPLLSRLLPLLRFIIRICIMVFACSYMLLLSPALEDSILSMTP